MAKTGMRPWLDYFPLDCQQGTQFNMIEAEFGIYGFAVLIKLHMQIYGGSGYYMLWNSDSAMLFSRTFQLERETVEAVVEAAVRRGIFSEPHYRDFGVLTSLLIQERYVEAKMRCKRVVMEHNYLIIEKEQLPKNVCVKDNDVYIYGKNVDTFPQRERETERETETETEKEKEREIETETAPAKDRTTRAPKAPKAASRHTPTLAEIDAYAKKNSYTHVNCEKFFLYYEGTGWKNVANWQAQLARWELQDAERAASKAPSSTLVDPFEYDMDELERILSGEYDDE